ncbi:hypothetical protein GZ998_03505 [Actinomyces sp. 594]|uniref:hypothetical protein n=1 Tax=Actinomyces sp. 594 TaxID=2057793 RepID=UPI001C586296|nr:hypothetical protein [Actinomyces sp. 594]MBW3068580.1 hypothetical protein [Actinomyces sp. 594]
MTAHPYVTAKARAWMLRAGGRPQDAAQLARWAQIAWHANRLGMSGVQNRGVIVAADGTLLAETRLCGRRRGVRAQHVSPDDMERITGSSYPTVADMAMGRIRHAVGQPVAHARFSELCEGPSEADVADK